MTPDNSDALLIAVQSPLWALAQAPQISLFNLHGYRTLTVRAVTLKLRTESMQNRAEQFLKIGDIELRISEVHDVVTIERERASLARRFLGQSRAPTAVKPTNMELGGVMRGAHAKARSELLKTLATTPTSVLMSFAGHAGHIQVVGFVADLQRADVAFRLGFTVVKSAANSSGSELVEALVSASRTHSTLSALARALARLSLTTNTEDKS